MATTLDDVIIRKAWFVKGISAGRGVMVVRPEYVAFIPTEEMRSLAGEIAKGLAFSAAGIVEIRGGRKLPVDQWLEEIRAQPADFDNTVREFARQAGGTCWGKTDARVAYKRVLCSGVKKGLWFNASGGSLRAAKALDGATVEKAHQLLCDWAS